MNRLPGLLLLAACCVAACAPAALPPAPPPASLPVAVVTSPGSNGAGSFNQLAIEGARRAAGAEVSVLESETPAAIGRNIETLIAQGNRHIVTVEPLAADPTAAVSNQHRGLTFSIVEVSFDPALPNVQGLIFRDDQAGYLAGALAGLVSQNQILGIVAGRDVPLVRLYVNGFRQGVQAACPECRVIVAYVGAAEDEAGAAREAERQIARGADVIFGVDGAAGAAAITYAARQGVFVIGAETDVYLTVFDDGSAPGADFVLTSALKRVDVAVQASVEARTLGTFAAGTLVFDAANSGVGLAPFHAAEPEITQAVQARLAEIEVGLADGTLDTGVNLETGELAE